MGKKITILKPFLPVIKENNSILEITHEILLKNCYLIFKLIVFYLNTNNSSKENLLWNKMDNGKITILLNL